MTGNGCTSAVCAVTDVVQHSTSVALSFVPHKGFCSPIYASGVTWLPERRIPFLKR